MKLQKTVFLLIVPLAVAAAGVFFILRPKTTDIRHIILISIDTCRADYLSCYGYPRPTTPNIDHLAQESILFENTVSPAPLTLPAHSSMLTGTIPPYHGVHGNINYKLDPENLTLPEILKPWGFNSAAVISSFVLDSQFGLNQGFDSYNDRFVEIQRNASGTERRGDETTDFALRWLDDNKDQKFFFFLHYYDPHTQYEPPEPFATDYADNLYAGEIAFVDACIGQVVEQLKKLDLYDSSLIIVAGDHGEMLGEHGEEDHSYFIYESAIKVPLIFKLPGNSPSGRIKSPAGLIDIVPTICGLLDIEAPTGIQGEDLSPCLLQKKAPDEKRYLYCESLTPTRFFANPLLGIVTDRWKYIQTTRPELYDLSADPAESTNLFEQEPKRVHLMEGQLKQILEDSVRRENPDSKLELDAETVRRLQSLGYVAGVMDESFQFDHSKEDPKDLISYHTDFQKATGLVFEEKYDQARVIFEKLLENRENFHEIYAQLAYIAEHQKDYPQAILYLNKAIKNQPSNKANYNALGRIYAKQQDYLQAETCFQKSLNLDPVDTQTLNCLGSVMLEQNKNASAKSYFNKALKIDPDDIVALNYLSSIMIRDGKFDQAVSYLQKSLRVKPGQLKQLNDITWIKATCKDSAVRDPAGALRLAEELLHLAGRDNPNVLDTVAAAYASAKKFEEAVAAAEAGVRLALSAGQEDLASSIRQRLMLYKQNKPFID